MRSSAIVLLCCLAACVAVPAGAAIVTSSFDNWVYSYTVTPQGNEAIRDFHVYANVDEGDVTHYYNLVMPAGWNFTVVQLPAVVALSWWTTGAPLPVGTASQFGYTHYCLPCCHSWIVTGTGTEDPTDPPLDGSWNHPDEPCNIPPDYADSCNGGGLVLAPRYPDMTAVENSTWGQLKVLYR